MSKKNLLPAVLLLLSACAVPERDTDPPPMPSTTPVVAANELKFSGIVGKVDTGCYADGVCFMEVDGKRVIFGMGWSREDWGQVAPREPIESYVGRRVEVYCGVREGVCSLVGNRAYYVR